MFIHVALLVAFSNGFLPFVYVSLSVGVLVTTLVIHSGGIKPSKAWA